MPAPFFELSPEQQAIVDATESRIQVIACAGSGKTEAMAQRVARLVGEGVPATAIVAFTFTERAAAALKARILERCAERLGEDAAARLGALFVGTIHAYCFRLLQQHAPEYGSYDLLDDHRLAALLSREHKRLGLDQLGDQHWAPIKEFMRNAEAVENELIPAHQLSGPFGECYARFCDALRRYRLLTYGQMISKAVEKLDGGEVLGKVQASLRHLVVDEYQDVNPAQERLIQLLTSGGAALCVVGDDDQAIYQWRGSDLGNILSFEGRNPGARRLPLSVNRRSSDEIIAAANVVAGSIPDRLPKTMKPARPACGFVPCGWAAETPAAEGHALGQQIAALRAQGYGYRDVAVLFRSVRTSAPMLLNALDQLHIPYQCAGRTGLFLQPEALLFGRTYAWLCGREWKDERFGDSGAIELQGLLDGYMRCFERGRPETARLRVLLSDWSARTRQDQIPAELVGDYYALLNVLGVGSWNLDEPAVAARAGTLARFSSLLADFEHTKRRARTVEENGIATHRGGANGGIWFYRQLLNYLQHYALDAYEGFAGEDDPALDAVQVLTVHQAKGLEWPVVLVPALVGRRFPSSRTGQKWKGCLLPEAAFPAAARVRYEGCEADERRLFYVALTRARDALYLSFFKQTERQRATPSPFLAGLVNGAPLAAPQPAPLPQHAEAPAIAPMRLSFSDLAAYETCPLSYRMRVLLGFEPQLAEELGFGRAVHSVLRRLAISARQERRVPTLREAEAILDQEFYLPFARRPAFEQLKKAALAVTRQYVERYGADLLRTWDTERPFELHVPGAAIQGRADVIYDHEGGDPSGLALADYKTAADAAAEDVHAFQLAIYAAAARQEGLDVRAAYLHDLMGKSGAGRKPVPVGPRETETAIARVQCSVGDLAARKFPPRPERERCGRCDVHAVCRDSLAARR